MRTWWLYVTLAGATAIMGCGLFPKNDSASSQGMSGTRPPPPSGNSNVTSRQAVIAGQVVDTFNQRRGGINLTLQPVDGGESINAISNDQGYFTVSSLVSGKRYRIQAKSQNGGVVSTGSTEATAPNVVVLVKLNDSRTETDGKATGMSGSVGGKHSSIAGADDNQNWSRGNPAATGQGDRLGAAPELKQPPKNTPSSTLSPRLGNPVTTEPTSPASSAPVKQEYITQESKVTPPIMNIRGPGNNTPGEPRSKSEFGSVNYFDFPFFDLDGKPTALSRYRGSLTLVELWNTDCIPCIDAMPELMKIQRAYSSKGLVVVGIAVDEKGKMEDAAAKIRWRTGQKGVDYPLLMEQPGQPAMQVFKCEQYPTLILFDENGRELWRRAGFNPDTKLALEQELKRHLR